MADPLLYEAEIGHASPDQLVRHLRNSAVMGGAIEVRLSPDMALRLARRIEDGRPRRCDYIIVERELPMHPVIAMAVTFVLAVSAYSCLRDVLTAVMP